MQTQTEKQAQMWTINEGGGYEVDEPGEKTLITYSPGAGPSAKASRMILPSPFESF
jgi:hypothetical protein